MNIEAQGAAIGFYAPVGGTDTLVAARRNLELSEDADTLDATHVDNMRVGGQIVGVDTTNNNITVERFTTKELERGQRGEIIGSSGNDGDYTWAASGVTDNGNGTHTISVNESIGDPTADGFLYVPSPHGNRVYKYNYNEWGVSLENVLLIDKSTGSFETSHNALVEAKRHGKTIGIKIRYPNTDGSDPRDEGDAIIEEHTLTSPYDELATVSISATGDGALTRNT